MKKMTTCLALYWIIWVFVGLACRAQGFSQVIRIKSALKVEYLTPTAKEEWVQKVRSAGEKIGGVEKLLKAATRDSGVYISYFHRDSILKFTLYNDEISPSGVSFQYGDTVLAIDPYVGNFSDYSTSDLIQQSIARAGIDFKIKDWFKELSLRDNYKKELVDGVLCDIYEAVKNPGRFGSPSAKYWITDSLQLPGFTSLDKMFFTYFYKGDLVFQSRFVMPSDAVHTTRVVAIDTLKDTSIQELFEAMMQKKFGLSAYYANLAENNLNKSEYLEKGDTLPSFVFRKIDGNTRYSLNYVMDSSSVIMIDLWAAWCAPCIAALPKLQKLKTKFGNDLSLISLNYHDSEYEKVMEVLKAYKDKWIHGFASHELATLLNPEKYYPRVILIDRNRTVLYSGTFDEKDIEELLSIHLQK